MSQPGVFWLLTLSIAIGIQVFVMYRWGDQLVYECFGNSSSSSDFLGIKAGAYDLAMSIGYWGFFICSMIGLLIYNTKLSKGGRKNGYEGSHYFLSIMMSVGSSLAWYLIVLAITLIVWVIVIVILIVCIAAAASGS